MCNDSLRKRDFAPPPTPDESTATPPANPTIEGRYLGKDGGQPVYVKEEIQFHAPFSIPLAVRAEQE